MNGVSDSVDPANSIKNLIHHGKKLVGKPETVPSGIHLDVTKIIMHNNRNTNINIDFKALGIRNIKLYKKMH